MFANANIMTAWGQVGKILPADESKNDSSLQIFINELKLIVQNRDIDKLSSILADSLYIPSGLFSEVTKSEFLKYYNSNNYDSLWNNFTYIFDIGGGKYNVDDPLEYCIPYTSINALASIDGADFLFDLGTYSVVLGNSVKVFKDKSTSSSILKVLNHDIVENNWDVSFPLDPKWTAINLEDGTKGFVLSNNIKSLYDIRCGIIKYADGWKIKYIDYFE